MERDAVHARQEFLCSWGFEDALHGRLQSPVFFFQQGQIAMPGSFRGFARLGPWKEVASLKSERAALSAFDAAAQRVLPIRRVQGKLPDIVSPWSRAPARLFYGDTLQRLPQVRAVPGFLPITFVQKSENQGIEFHSHPRNSSNN